MAHDTESYTVGPVSYTHLKRGLGIDCGMLYIVRLPDRSLFLVDGGEMEQATEAARCV